MQVPDGSCLAVLVGLAGRVDLIEWQGNLD
jgi:hypothetical protein